METEKEKTGFMLNILKRARNLCLETSRDHMFEIKNSFAVFNMQNSEEEGTNFEYIDSITTTRTVAVQTPVYTKLLANFRYLSKEQEKTILEIRNVFEQRLSESFLRIGTDMIVKEFKIEEHDTVVYYVRKCMTICWSMCRHEPPVHIEFSENGENQPYVTNIFKPYTKTGKFLDFVVWPALFLYENGPLLAKGVAEGRK